MTSWLWNYLGYGSGQACKQKTAVRALPANWYTSSDMYELERRAIFSRKWLLTTHKSRLVEPGTWLRFDIAGFNIIVAKDRKGEIHAMHNICRHRAYPVVEQDAGKSHVFACRYHGWSYGLNGNLAKAPGYQDLGGFDRSQNGLLPIHVHIDVNGFVYINMDAKPVPEVAWEDDFNNVDKQPRFQNYNFDDYVFDHAWEMDGDYNWKILADNYNECYHCKNTHPDIPAVANLESYDVFPEAGHIDHDPATTPEQMAAGLRIANTYYFPNASMSVAPHFMFIQRFVPVGPKNSTMNYQVWRNKNSPEDEFQKINQIYKRVMGEDKVLCNQAQKNINAGVFVNGEMHPHMEKGPLYFQKSAREAVTAHWGREQAAGREIWPARQQLPDSAGGVVSEKDVEFCSGLACSPQVAEQLAW